MTTCGTDDWAFDALRAGASGYLLKDSPREADYILVRGLARPDCVPVDDLAIRSVVGEYLGPGPRVSPDEVSDLLKPFKPYRGLLAFYLLAHHRLRSATIS